MSDLKIISTDYRPVTIVPDDFIENYMLAANGDYVKIYLYLLHCFKSGKEFSVSSLADLFQCTENDIKRALKYWESKGLLQLEETASKPEKHSYTATEAKSFKDQAEVKQLSHIVVHKRPNQSLARLPHPLASFHSYSVSF